MDMFGVIQKLAAGVAVGSLFSLKAYAACSSPQCNEATATLSAYVAAQDDTFSYEEFKSWINYTNLTQAPHWETATLVRGTAIEDMACAQDACTARVVYDTIGTVVPLELFTPKRERVTVKYTLSRKSGRMLVNGPLPGKFIDGTLAAKKTLNMLTGNVMLRNFFDSLGNSIVEAMNAP